MKTGIFVWTVANDYGARIPDKDLGGVMDPAIFKVNDGLNQMQSVNSAVALAKLYRDQGIDFMPWGVARGFSLAIARAEGLLAGQYAAATGSPYVLDLEPYPDYYWQGISGTPRAFCQGYEESAPSMPLRLTVDARNVGINLEEWVAEPVVGIFHPQAYYTDFGSHDMGIGIMSAINPLLAAGVSKSRIYPVLPVYQASTGNPSTSPKELALAITFVAGQGFLGFALWRRGLMSPDQVAMLQLLPDPFPPPPFIPPPVDVFATLTEAKTSIQTVIDTLFGAK